MGTDRPMGSIFNHTEKTMSSRRASQKEGVLERVRQQPRTSRSGQRPRLAPAIRPSASPSRPDSSQADSSTHRELPSRWPMTASTGWR